MNQITADILLGVCAGAIGFAAGWFGYLALKGKLFKPNE